MTEQEQFLHDYEMAFLRFVASALSTRMFIYEHRNEMPAEALEWAKRNGMIMARLEHAHYTFNHQEISRIRTEHDADAPNPLWFPTGDLPVC